MEYELSYVVISSSNFQLKKTAVKTKEYPALSSMLL